VAGAAASSQVRVRVSRGGRLVTFFRIDAGRTEYVRPETGTVRQKCLRSSLYHQTKESVLFPVVLGKTLQKAVVSRPPAVLFWRSLLTGRSELIGAGNSTGPVPGGKNLKRLDHPLGLPVSAVRTGKLIPGERERYRPSPSVIKWLYL